MANTEEGRESLLRGAFRSCFRGTGTIVGWGLGIILVILLFNLVFGESTPGDGTAQEITPPESKYELHLLSGLRGKQEFSEADPSILVMDIKGVIGALDMDAHSVLEQLQETRGGILHKSKLKALVLRINSPGGVSTDIDEIYQLLEQFKKDSKLPIYAFVEQSALSGGYYVAMIADKIYATRSSLIGSVGVIVGPFLNFSSVMEKIGVQSLTISQGEHKDMLNPLRPWKEDEEKIMKDLTAHYYKRFIEVVTLGRPKLSPDFVKNTVEANIYPADRAIELGMIDQEAASLEEAVNLIAAELDLDKSKVQTIAFRHKDTTWQSLFNENSPMVSGEMKHEIKGISDLPGLDASLFSKPLYLDLRMAAPTK